MQRKTFVLCTNLGTYDATKVCLHSLLKHNPECTVYVFSRDLPKDAFKKYSVRHILVDESVDSGAYGLGHYPEGVSNGMVLRLWAFDYLKTNSNESRIVYMDVDTIVNGDLKEMFEVNLGPTAWLAAAKEHSDIDPIARKLYPIVDDNWKIRNKRCKVYFNSGVLVIDLNRMPKDIYKYYLNNAKFYKFPDQDCLNDLVKDDYVVMPQFYNAMPDFYLWKYKEPAQLLKWRNLMTSSKIIHYAGGHKPFSEVANGSRYFLCVPYELYYQYALEIKDDLSEEVWNRIVGNMKKCRYVVEFNNHIRAISAHIRKHKEASK